VKITFVTDGGLELGMGHVGQSTTFAKELREHAEVSFLTKSSERVVAMIRDAGFPVVALPDDDAIFAHLAAAPPSVVVFDKLDVAEALARRIRTELPSGLAIFTNLTDANAHAHLAVTADIGSRFENVSYTDEKTGTLTYFGPKYWVLRREFYEYQRKRKAPPAAVTRALLIFGGSDPANLTSVVLDELLGMAAPPRIDVVLGAHFGHDADVAAVLARRSPAAEAVLLHRNIKNVAELMFAADLVVASPGLSAFEALCVGTPVVVIPQDALQGDTYRGFMRMLERIEASQLPGMLARKDFTYPADPAIARMEIGQGVGELVTRILELGRR
jgi:spore coat polysaccharide biosynthesis predicted glycosyltransferase SpsG